jgi:hypothetical protein
MRTTLALAVLAARTATPCCSSSPVVAPTRAPSVRDAAGGLSVGLLPDVIGPCPA